jgi:hypothetical protein
MRWLVAVGLLACRSKQHAPPAEADDAAPPIDASVADAPKPWPELDDFTKVAPDHVVPLAPKGPRIDVGGPVISGDVAVVSSSQLGFVGIDWRRGQIAWTKPAGAHVAPPIVTAEGIALLGDCMPALPDALACLRVVTPTGSDVGYTPIPRAGLAEFAAATGTQDVWRVDDHTVRWRRGDAAIAIDLVTGTAKPASAAPPPLVVTYKDRHWDVFHEQGRLVARVAGKQVWATQRPYAALLGTVWLPGQSPLLRIAQPSAFRGEAEIHVHDIDATGSLHGQFLKPVPGMALLGWGTSSIGDAAIAVRLDSVRDFIVGYAANAYLVYVYPLPPPRPSPTGVDHDRAIGIALAPDAVVVFHDADTVTILPELSAPPTTPGAARASLQIPTP